MASILDRYGIKEVADVTFYDIDANGNQGAPVLYLDTLKVSTIEQTAETTDARGGKGNPKLVTWDYGKDITVTLEDALFSAKSLSIMFGNGTVDSVTGVVTRTVMVRTDAEGELPEFFTTDVFDTSEGGKGAVRKKVYFGAAMGDGVTLANSGIGITAYTSEKGVTADSFAALKGKAIINGYDKVFITYDIAAAKKEIVISGDTFPGTYYVTGDTYARSDVNGEDQFFQFIIPKAKVTSENTITLEAEGDPSVFNMNLSVLRPEDGEMMKLVQYDLLNPAVASETINKAELINLVNATYATNDAGNDDAKYSEDSWTAFTTAYTAALTEIAKTEGATKETVEEATKDLLRAYNDLEASEEDPTI